MFEECPKLKKVNRFTFKKLNNLKLEKESLVAKLEESTRILNELRVEKESLDIIKVKSLMSNLEKSNTQLQYFSTDLRKLIA